MEEKKDIIEEIKKSIQNLLDNLKERYTDIQENLESVFTEVSVYFMQNLNNYDVYSLREAIYDLSQKFIEEKREKDHDYLFHISLIFSYLKENLHPVEIYGEGIVYNEMFVEFMSDLSEGGVNLEYPLAIDFINNILQRVGFLKPFVEEEDLLSEGILFYKSLEGKIADFCFNKVLFNLTPIAVDNFFKVSEDKIIFNKKFAKNVYQTIYEALEKKFSNVKKSKKGFSVSLSDKNFIKVRKFIQSVVDEREMLYMLSVAKDNTENPFIVNIDYIIDTLKNDNFGALRLALGLGNQYHVLNYIALRKIPTDRFLDGIIALLNNYKNQPKDFFSDTFDLTLEEFIINYSLDIPLITDNINILEKYKNVIDNAKELFVYIGSLDNEDDIETFSPKLKLLYLFRIFKFRDYTDLYSKYSEDLEPNINYKVKNLVAKFLINEIDKDRFIEEIDNIYKNEIKDIIDEADEYEDVVRTYLTIGGDLKILKFILTGAEDDDSEIYPIIKAYLNGDKEKIKELIKDKVIKDEDIDITIESYNNILRVATYNALNNYPFDEKVYQLYNPTYKYKIPKLEGSRVVWK